MALTISVTLSDEDVQRFIDLYNEDAGTEITVDMLNQAPDLQEAIAEDMVTFWFEAMSAEESISAYDLYSDLIDYDIVTLPGDPALGNHEDDDVEY